MLPGVIGDSYSYGTFLEYPCCGGMVGLAPTRYLSDEFVTDVSRFYSKHQTVFSKVSNRLDSAGYRICRSSKLTKKKRGSSQVYDALIYVSL